MTRAYDWPYSNFHRYMKGFVTGQGGDLGKMQRRYRESIRGTVKLLLPPRQSRGNSQYGLGELRLQVCRPQSMIVNVLEGHGHDLRLRVDCDETEKLHPVARR